MPVDLKLTGGGVESPPEFLLQFQNKNVNKMAAQNLRLISKFFYSTTSVLMECGRLVASTAFLPIYIL
jgi:hypothetical protein